MADNRGFSRSRRAAAGPVRGSARGGALTSMLAQKSFSSPVRASAAFGRLVIGWLRRAANVRLLGMTLTAVALTACSPEYDWRTVTDTSQGYTIDMPAKPTQDERQIALAGTAMPMHVRAAHLAHSVFAVGVVDLPSDDPRLQREVLDTLRSALGRHLGAPGEARPARVPLAAGGDASAVDVAVTGVAGSAPRTQGHSRMARGARAARVSSGDYRGRGTAGGADRSILPVVQALLTAMRRDGLAGAAPAQIGQGGKRQAIHNNCG